MNLKNPFPSMNKPSHLSSVFLVVLVDLIGFGIVLPLLPFYADQFGVSALMTGILFSVYSLAQFFVSPFWGQLSDRIGRRPVMLISTAGAAFSYILFAVSHSFWLLLISRMAAGIMAGNISAAQAYVADVTTPENRAKGMGLIGAAFGIGFVLGPAIATFLVHPVWSGWLESLGLLSWANFIQQYPYAAPGYVAAFLSVLSFLLVFFHLPESRTERSIPQTGKPARFMLLTQKFWSNLSRDDENQQVPLLLISLGLLSFGQSSLYGVFPLFCQMRFSMLPKDVGVLYIAMGFVAVLVQGGLIRVLVKKFQEEHLFLCGNILMVMGLAALPFATSQGLLTLFLMIMTLGASLSVPMLTSLVSKHAPLDHVGATLGASQGMAGLGRVIGPAWGGALYTIMPYLPFVMTAGFVSITISAGLLLRKEPEKAIAS